MGDLLFSSLLCAVMTQFNSLSFNVFFCVRVRDTLCFGGGVGVYAGVAIVVIGTAFNDKAYHIWQRDQHCWGKL